MLADDSSFSPQKRAALGMVISIGAQCKSAASARDIGQGYFRQAQSQAFQGMLEDPDIDVVRSFLLMAFYLLGECRRNAAFMYLGIATRAAVALGLHSQESYQDLNDLEDNKRWVSGTEKSQCEFTNERKEFGFGSACALLICLSTQSWAGPQLLQD